MNASNKSSTALETKMDVWYFSIKAVICLITVFGNALVIFLIFKCRRLRVLPNTFVVTLAIADMLVGAVNTPSEFACKYWHGKCNWILLKVTYDILYHLSTTNLCALALDRYIATARPLKYPLIMTRKKIIIIILIAWISAATTPFTAYIFILNGINFEVLQIIDIVIFQILPPILLGIIYIRMAYVAAKLNKIQIRQINQISFNYGNTENRKLKATATVKMTGVIIFVFIICYILAVGRRLFYLSVNHSIPYPVVGKLSRILLNVNSAANVFVYALVKGDFKRELKNKLRCLYFYSNNNLSNSCEDRMEMRQEK